MTPYLDGLIFLSLQHILGLLVPGPCTGLVIKNSLYDRKAGLTTVFGAVAGSFSVKFLSVMGFALLLRNNPTMFYIFKLCGAGYLIFLGASNLYKSYCNYNSTKQEVHVDYAQASPFIAGYLISLTNPLSSVRFIVIFSTIITPDLNLSLQISYLAVLAIISLIFYVTVALFFSTPILQNKLERYRYLITAALGVTLIYWGIQVLNTNMIQS
jgi:threonine/homoserine/homoserine lactone efflux protein